MVLVTRSSPSPCSSCYGCHTAQHALANYKAPQCLVCCFEGSRVINPRHTSYKSVLDLVSCMCYGGCGFQQGTPRHVPSPSSLKASGVAVKAVGNSFWVQTYPEGTKYPNVKKTYIYIYMYIYVHIVSVLGIVVMVWSIYFIFGYLDS